jgi:hypothetical protein
MCCMNVIVVRFPCILLTCRLGAWVSRHVFRQLIRSPSVLNFSWVIGLDVLCCAMVTVTPIAL